MKKIITSLLAIVLSTGVYAQIVSTTSSFEVVVKEKKVRIKPKLEWYAKVGLNLMSANWGKYAFETYGKELGSDVIGGGKVKAGFNVGGGFISHFRPSNPSDFYWGAEVGVSQVGGGFDSVNTFRPGIIGVFQSGSSSYVSIYCGPGIGWMKPLTGNIKLDVHFNPEALFIVGSGSDVDGVERPSYNDDQYDTVVHISNVNVAHFALRGGIGVWYKKFNIDLSYRGVVKFSENENGYNNFILSVGYAF